MTADDISAASRQIALKAASSEIRCPRCGAKFPWHNADCVRTGRTEGLTAVDHSHITDEAVTAATDGEPISVDRGGFESDLRWHHDITGTLSVEQVMTVLSQHVYLQPTDPAALPVPNTTTDAEIAQLRRKLAVAEDCLRVMEQTKDEIVVALGWPADQTEPELGDVLTVIADLRAAALGVSGDRSDPTPAPREPRVWKHGVHTDIDQDVSAVVGKTTGRRWQRMPGKQFVWTGSGLAYSAGTVLYVENEVFEVVTPEGPA